MYCFWPLSMCFGFFDDVLPILLIFCQNLVFLALFCHLVFFWLFLALFGYFLATLITSCLKNFSITENLWSDDKFQCDSCCTLQEAHVRGHSTTTWTKIYLILTPFPPRVDKRGHLTYPPPVHVDKRWTKAPPLKYQQVPHFYQHNTRVNLHALSASNDNKI